MHAHARAQQGQREKREVEIDRWRDPTVCNDRLCACASCCVHGMRFVLDCTHHNDTHLPLLLPLSAPCFLHQVHELGLALSAARSECDAATDERDRLKELHSQVKAALQESYGREQGLTNQVCDCVCVYDDGMRLSGSSRQTCMCVLVFMHQ